MSYLGEGEMWSLHGVRNIFCTLYLSERLTHVPVARENKGFYNISAFERRLYLIEYSKFKGLLLEKEIYIHISS